MSRADTLGLPFGMAARLTLDDDEPGCYLTADDLFSVGLVLVEAQVDIADRLSRLLNGDAGRTIVEMAKILDVSVPEVVVALCYLSQAGAVLVVLDVAGSEKGYRLEGWV